jgi:maltoporin
MKKFFCIVLTSVVFISMTQAQKTQFGIKAGLNAASVKVTGGDDWNGKAGAHFGFLAHIHCSDNFAIQPEITYSMQGGKDGDDKLKLNYINIPVLAQYMFNNGFRLQTGPQIGFLTTGKTKSGDVEIDIKDDLKSTDFAWTFGAGYLFPEGIGIDARYNLGISNISETEDFEAKNMVFQVGVFYHFGAKKR